MNREMQRALEADGEKLRELTGEDHGPWEFVTCPECDGSGIIARRVTVYEHGCGFPHDDTDEQECPKCGGVGGWIDEAEGSPSIKATER